MLCQNCGKNDANFHYTQIINGVKKEMTLCDSCAKELGVKDIEFSMPINFSSFLTDFFNEYNDSFLPAFATTKELMCNKCGMTFDDFVNSGEFGCGNCYITFADRISPVLKKLHGSSKHIGREYKDCIDELEYNKKQFEKTKKENESKPKEDDKLSKLQKDLKKAIKEERYEDAAELRDKIKDLDVEK